ncbi:hypothetical protein J2X63_001375 [Agromyces sp. 3263]|uniref:hypothetical protein n=1 Tax=Agromyces sp. 3263 TaxID=2817750 RepID=UPI00285DAE68|nr:hypothetical protein [Agromyces sp. 3263]MDR6905689.1 hypothetical protein [Agromyces sp. 3263]
MEHGEPGRRDDQRGAFLERFGAVYRGGWDPADALAWRADPDRPLPSGEPSPSARVRELELVVYSTRTADGSDAGEELARLIGELDRQRLEIDRAIAEASAPDTPDPRPAERPAGGVEAARGGRSPRLRTTTVAVAAAAAGVVLALGVLQLAGGSPGTDHDPTGDGVRGSVEDVVPYEDRSLGAALQQEFDRVQDPTDFPTQPVSTWFIAESFRRLPVEPFRGAVYLARTTTGDVCLLLLPVDGRLASGCVAEGGVSTSGLAAVTRAPTGDTPPGGDEFIRVRWTGDGAIVEIAPVGEPPSA